MNKQAELSASDLIKENLDKYFNMTASQHLFDNKIHCFFSNVPYPFLNIITRTNYSSDANEKLISLMVNRYRDNNINSFCWFIEEMPQAKNFEELLVSYQFDKLSSFSGLVCDLKEPFKDIVFPKDFMLHEVTSVQQLNDWATPFQIGFNYSAIAIDRLVECYSHKINSKFKHFVVYKDSQPIACASILITEGGVAGFYNLAVLPEYQNRGLGLALQKIRINYALTHHCNIAVMQAAAISEQIAKKLGFYKVTNFIPYLYDFSKTQDNKIT